MENFWDYSVWGGLNLLAVLLLSLLFANFLKKTFKFLRNSLIPTSVLAGIILLAISTVYKAIAGVDLFDAEFFGGNGMSQLEIITYHTLALGFIASSLTENKTKLNKKRSEEIFDTGVTTVSTYLLQGILGLAATLIIALFVSGLFRACGVLLPFGFGQGSGQALNWGNVYETGGDGAYEGFSGGRSFGLTVAALGFLSASVGGVFHLNLMKKKGRLKLSNTQEKKLTVQDVQSDNEIPVNGSLDKITVQIALIAISYLLAYLLMFGLCSLLPGMKSLIYGFNFLIGVLTATLIKAVLKLFNKKRIIKKQYTNNFLLNRISNCCFDIMVVAGIAAIKLDLIKQYWWILLILAVIGTISTYLYNIFVAKKLFKSYYDEQFLVMYGMLTGTASTGIMLLREIDSEFNTPAQENLILQNFPAIVFGFPMMLLAELAPKQPELTLAILFVFFIVMQLILFRKSIFKSKKKKEPAKQEQQVQK